MEHPHSDADEVELEVAYFELVVGGPSLTLLRLGGRWSGLDPADLESPTLVLEADGEEHRLQALPEAQAAGPAPDGAPWRAAFAAPAALAAARSTAYGVDVGSTVSLPQPAERRLHGLQPDGPAPAAAPADTVPPVHHGVGPRLLAAAVVLVVVLLVVVAAATSGDDEASAPAMPPGAQRVALMRVLAGGRAAGQIVRDARGRLSVRATGLAGRRSGVWLFDSVIDARLIGTIEGPAGQVELPSRAQLRRFRYIDISREDDDNANHSGRSVLRVATASVR
jgi:hypothetical protein